MTSTTSNAIPTVSQIVRDDYRTADVFKKWGINYCCGGNLSLDDACTIKKLDIKTISDELLGATKTVCLPNSLQFNDWPLSFLVDYIVHIHHGYIKQAMPALINHLNSFVSGHVKKYPYLPAVEESFLNLSNALSESIQQEEDSLFPYVRQITNTYERQEKYGSLFVRTMRKPLAETIEKEQSRISRLLLSLREAANNYQLTSDACTNHQVIYHKLKEFDNDLVQHKHLENNILFPKVLEMEKSLLQF